MDWMNQNWSLILECLIAFLTAIVTLLLFFPREKGLVDFLSKLIEWLKSLKPSKKE